MGLNKPFIIIRFAVCVLVLLCCTQTQAQVNARQALLNIKARADTSIKNFPPEKVYLQTDRPYYSVGDTIWYRGWVIDAPSTLLSTKSGLLHVEIATDSNVVVQKFLLPVENGITWGNITLNEKDFKPGSYIIRAYTNWMRNFGAQTFFYKRINITGGYEDNWTVKVRTDTTRVNGQPNVKAILQFSYADKLPVVGKPVTMQVMNGRKTITKYTLDTELTGTVDISFKPPQSGKDLYIKARVDNKGNAVNIPLRLNKADDTDLQFMPEGGDLVAGIQTHVGFKAIGTNGRGINVSGTITDSRGNKVTTFRSGNCGMGNFMLTPLAGERYTATITTGSGSKTFALPKVQASGLGLFVLNHINSDSLRITVSASADVLKQGSPYFFIAKSRGVIHYAAIMNFDNKSALTSYLNKNLFPTGITHLLITDDKGRTLNERLVFIDHHDALKIQVTAPPQIAAKDSVDLNLLITDSNGKPVQGTFSLAVTDDARVKTDTLNDANIITSMLLTSELRGYVEAPGYYFSKDANAWQALDDLLLTQGWVSYDAPAKGALFPVEEDYSVNGRLTNLFGKPAAGLGVNMFSIRPFLSRDTITGKDGRFKMPLPLVDTPAFILKAVKKNGKPSGIPITVNEFQMPHFVPTNIPADLPWNVNTGDTVIRDINAAISKRRQTEKMPEGTRLLQGVTISAKKMVKDSRNLNGAGNADIVLDEKDMEAAGKKTLLKLIEEKIPGFFPKYPKGSPVAWYYVKSKFAFFIIDGVNLFDIVPPRSYIDERDYLASYTAESIKGIELNYSAKYNNVYLAKYCPGCDIIMLDYAFIEITTRSGSGPHMADARGIYLYKPLPLSLPAQFYKPKYTANKTDAALDNRPTIAWEPNVITNTEGKASVGFHAGMSTGNYTVIVQGVGMDGSLGVRYFPLKVKVAAGL
ncbi:hypothetical protein D0C36_10010 [Mucilaginibacter conchicola]|uniref:Carboxypeptidase regulatory-like domain-containing protein n=1 Tax=Mucilaginibacter conchicola TaxID=2303333 RepID=A0A372NSA0_9SPHI|nr:hypothetical protein [Mucilaginibacter conchicola]RFZ91781.1 hypothetical protein D0C36_10010 [Mucilaginibacter conchicola]